MYLFYTVVQYSNALGLLKESKVGNREFGKLDLMLPVNCGGIYLASADMQQPLSAP
jgi:hypothetical protein